MAAVARPEVPAGLLQAFWLALRPRTLSVGAVPVVVGTAVAAAEGHARALPALAAGIAALCLQVASNLVNDYADFEHGTDGVGRLGPPRAAASGWLQPQQLRRAAALAFCVAAVIGVYLVAVGGLWITLGGLLALFSAWAYTAGPSPLGYRGYGDVLVFVFFGLFAVQGTHVVQTGTLSAGALVSAIPVGLLATAVLAVNNLRDLASDAAVGKRTVAVCLGEAAARRYTVALVLASYAALPLVAAVAGPAAALLPLWTLPRAWRWLGAVGKARGSALNPLLGATARLQLAFGAALALGWLL